MTRAFANRRVQASARSASHSRNDNVSSIAPPPYGVELVDRAPQPARSRKVPGRGGYVYEQFPDGTVLIVSGPGVQRPVRLRKGPALEAITTEIGPFPLRSDERPAATAPAVDRIEEGGSWLDWLASQGRSVGEAAADVFGAAKSWGQSVLDSWFRDDAPRRDAPVAPGAGWEAASAADFAGTGTPLELALQKVGQVDYVDPKHGRGEGKRKFTKAETKALKRGAADIDVASCSPFAYWTLAASGIEINEPIQNEGVSIRQLVNLEKAALGGKKYANLVKSGDPRIRGAATAFEKAGIGAEVDKSEACPGDYVQTFDGLAGHSTIVHRSHCLGVADFDKPNSPNPKGDAQQALGLDGSPVRFILDENTDPLTVGEFVTERVELLGAHLGGTSSAGEETAPGVYTKKAVRLDGFDQAFVGRLHTSVWANRGS